MAASPTRRPRSPSAEALGMQILKAPAEKKAAKEAKAAAKGGAGASDQQ